MLSGIRLERMGAWERSMTSNGLISTSTAPTNDNALPTFANVGTVRTIRLTFLSKDLPMKYTKDPIKIEALNLGINTGGSPYGGSNASHVGCKELAIVVNCCWFRSLLEMYPGDVAVSQIIASEKNGIETPAT